MNSPKYYDSLAAVYENVYMQRISYHRSVDSMIKDHEEFGFWKDVLDIGSGNGNRLIELFCHTDARLVCVENSNKMVELLKNKSQLSEVLEADICKMSEKSFDRKFDLVLLQWNVIGHLEDFSEAVRVISAVSKSKGRLIFDFNNPFNMRQYGVRNVIRNSLKFLINRDLNRMSFPIAHNGLTTKSNFFRPKYVIELLSLNGFEVEKVCFLNYSSGKKTGFLSGQIYIEAKKK